MFYIRKFLYQVKIMTVVFPFVWYIWAFILFCILIKDFTFEFSLLFTMFTLYYGHLLQVMNFIEFTTLWSLKLYCLILNLPIKWLSFIKCVKDDLLSCNVVSNALISFSLVWTRFTMLFVVFMRLPITWVWVITFK